MPSSVVAIDNYVNARAVEPEPKNSEWRSLKFDFPFNRHSLWSKPIVQIIKWFLVFTGPNLSGPEPKTSRLEPDRSQKL